MRSQSPGRFLRHLDGRDPAPEGIRPERPLEAPGPAGGKNVVRASGVVAEGSRAALTHEDATGGRDRAREEVGVLGEDLEVLWGDGVGKQHSRLGVRDLDDGHGRLRGDSPIRRELCDRVLDLVEDHRLHRGRDQQAVRPMLGLGAEVERHPLRIGRVARDHHQLRGAGDSVDPHVADELALGLLDVAVSWPGDHVDRLDPLRTQRQRRNRLGAADRVDLGGAADRRRGEDHVGNGLRTGTGRRGQGDPPHTGGARRDAAHQNRRGIDPSATRCIDGGGRNRDLAKLDRLALSQLQIAVLG